MITPVFFLLSWQINAEPGGGGVMMHSTNNIVSRETI